jgi:hypothetical protein
MRQHHRALSAQPSTKAAIKLLYLALFAKLGLERNAWLLSDLLAGMAIAAMFAVYVRGAYAISICDCVPFPDRRERSSGDLSRRPY